MHFCIRMFSGNAIIKRYTERGEDYTFYVLEWRNPSPEKRIEKVILRRNSDSDIAVLLTNMYAENI